MQPPPGYEYATPRRGMSPSAVAIVVLAGCIVIALLIVFILGQVRARAQTAACLVNMKQLSMALMMYTQDYDEQLPPRTTWLDDFAPYVKTRAVDKCPARPLPYGYAFNAALDRKDISRIAPLARTPALFESSLGFSNASDLLESFTTPHLGNGGAVGSVGFLDGHVRQLTTAPRAKAGLPLTHSARNAHRKVRGAP